ncbi:MAG TPA: hypothetical protein VKB81_10485, partial [Nitrospira sp.]|nr:hypothetical protein [Nitrospira sp.]
GMPAQESVDDLAKLEQITELAERRCAVHIVLARRCVGIAPVSHRRGMSDRLPFGRMTSASRTPRPLMLLITGSVCPSNAWCLRVTVT